MKNNIFDLNYEELELFLCDKGVKKFRAKQVWKFLYDKLVDGFDKMNNIDAFTKSILENNFIFKETSVVKHLSDKEGTQKALLKLHDGQTVETVMMKHNHGLSVCVTTQIGCKIGCSFCASHLGGFKRNLSSGEITQQVLFWQKIAKESERRVSHIVVMGIGEPMDNLENVLKFFDIVNESQGLNIGARHITLSTSGIVPQIYEFAEYPKQINLAISLHAPNDALRSSIMKINNVFNIKDIFDAVDFYIKKTNRRVSFEYIMLKGINDSAECAEQLATLLKGINCHVNLIPFNSVEEYELSKSSHETTKIFENILLNRKIQVTTRHSKGQDIDGACGQLRRKNEN